MISINNNNLAFKATLKILNDDRKALGLSNKDLKQIQDSFEDKTGGKDGKILAIRKPINYFNGKSSPLTVKNGHATVSAALMDSSIPNEDIVKMAEKDFSFVTFPLELVKKIDIPAQKTNLTSTFVGLYNELIQKERVFSAEI